MVEELKSDLLAKGWEITFKETLLTEKQIDQSNEVLINNIALEKILPFAEKSENCCASCEDLLGLPTLCRTIEFQGKTYEAIPAELIKKAIWQVIEKA